MHGGVPRRPTDLPGDLGPSAAALEYLLEALKRGSRLLIRNTSDDDFGRRRAERSERRPELVAVVKMREPVAHAEPVLGHGARASGAAALPARGPRRSHDVQGPVHLEAHAAQVQRLIHAKPGA